MDGNNQTSFIPKRPLVPAEGTSYEPRGVSIVTVICVILFLGVMALSAGSYFYQKYLSDQLVKKIADLQKARAGFDLDTIKELKRLDTRIETSKTLIDQHAAISGVFDVLQQATLKTIRYTSFDISSSADADTGDGTGASTGGIQIKMNGTAQSYSSVALQSDLLNKTKGIKEPVFSNIGLDDKGNVVFNVSAFVDPAILRYRVVNDLSKSGSQQSNATPATTAATTTPTIPAPN